MGTKVKKGFGFLKIFSILFLVLGVALGGAILGLRMPENSVSDTTIQVHGNTLALNQDFTENPYVIVGDKVYTYKQLQQQQTQPKITSPVATTQALSFDAHNKLELVFYKQNITELNSAQTLQFNDQDIASQFQAIKNDDGTISIQIIDETNVVEITTSTDADYTLYSLAFSTQATLNYANGEFSVGEKRGATSFTASATPQTTAQILNLSGGSFKFSGAKTYTPKSGKEGRAFYQTGGTLTLEGITLDGFWVNNTIETNYGGAVLNMGGALNVNCTIKNSNAFVGGAVGNMGVMNITGGTYSDNTAMMAGAAIANMGVATIDGGIFTDNAATHGAALYNTLGNMTINDATIYENTATAWAGAVFNDDEMGEGLVTINGGEIYNNSAEYGGALADDFLCTMIITDINLHDNTATRYGGGIWSAGTLTIDGGIFNKNTAISGGSVYVEDSVDTTIVTTISGGTFSENSAVYSESDTSQFSGGGGAIVVGGGTFDITGGEFLNNTATMGGGAIGSLVDTNISNATFTGNMATDQEFETLGGAVAFQNEVEVAISNCTFTGNASVLGSAVAALYGPTVIMSNCNVSGNQAMAGTFAALEADIMVMGSSTITQNQAMASTIAIVQGGIFGMDNNVSATENHSDMGAMMIVIEGYLGLTGCTVEDNTYGESLEVPGDIALIENAAIIVAGELTSNYEVFVQPATAGTVVAMALDDSMASVWMPIALEHLFLVGVDEDTNLKLNSSNQIVIGGSGLAPGVYIYGTDELVYDWATLVAGGIISVSNGTISMSEDSLDALVSSLNGELAKIVVDSSVTTIPDQFMAQSSGVASIIFPSSITSVGMAAFGYSSDLQEVIFKDSYVSFGIGAFMLCQSLNRLDVGDNVVSYSAFSFAGTYLSEVSIHINANTSVEPYAFQCSFVKEITVDSSHPTMTTLNGVVYSKDYSVLALCPTGVSGELTIPNSVGMILAGAFFGCYNLSGTLTMPSGLTEMCDTTTQVASGITAAQLLGLMGFGLFSYAGMSNIVLPANITYLPYYTFSNCPNLSTITWPTNLQTIDQGCFKDCDGLINIVIPNTVTSIGEDCFSGCDNLKTADLGDGITTIGERLFYQAPALEWVDIGASTTTIQQMAFYQCPSLKTVVWNSSLQTIGLSAFYQCSSLQGTFTAPSALRTISSHAFQNCTSLTGVVFNSSLSTLGDHAFQGCTGLTGTLTIPNSVTTISRQAFQDCSGLTKLVMGNSVTTIGDLAFYNCNKISGSLSLPSTLMTIGQSAFRNMLGLTGTLTLGSSMQTVGAYAFRDCTGFTTLYVYGNNLALGEQAFYNCTGLTSLNLNSGLLSIGDSAFYGCNKIYGRLTIPSTTTTIENNAFYNCSRFTGLTLGSSVTTIGDTAFYGCSGMSGSVTFPTTLQTIGKSAFRSLKLTGSINLPSIVTIGESAFQACTGFTSLKIGDTATTVDSLAFYGCTGLTSMDLGTGIQTIGQSAFRNCSNAVGTIKLPNIQVIGNYAFHTASKITSVTIGGTIQQVGDGVFANCTSILTHYYIDCTSIPTLTNANCFNNINANCKIWVPGALYEDWIVATNWSNWEPYIFAYYEQEGLFDANGNQLYTWRQMVSNGMITLSEDETTITATNITATGNLIIPSSITKIGRYAFSGNTTLTGVTFSDSLVEIGYAAFDDCTGLTGTLTIPDSVVNIGGHAFDSCSGINNLQLGNSIQTIGEAAFQHIGLPEGYVVQFPASVTSIANYSFNYPSGVYKYTFDCRNLSPTTTIGTFLVGGSGTSYLTEYILPYEKAWEFTVKGWTTIPINNETYKWMDSSGNVYEDTGGLYDVNTSERIYTWAQLISNGYITVNGNTSGSAVTGYSTNLTGKLIISTTISTISASVFANKTGLKYVVIPKNVTSIGQSAFSGCTGLTGVTFLHTSTSTTLSIGTSAFYNCTGLTGVYADSSDFFRDIAVFSNSYANPLYYARRMYSLSAIGSEIQSISYSNIAVANTENSLVGDYAYYNCLSLTFVKIGGNIDIGAYTFAYCSNVLTYDFSGYDNDRKPLPACGVNAFIGINANAKIIVPAALYYSWIAATNWSSYKNYIVPDGELPDSGGGLYDASGNELYSWDQLVSNGYVTVSGTTITGSNYSNLSGKLVIPSTITEIGESAFFWCSNLTSVEFSEGLTTIGDSAFYWTGLSGSITLPNSVTSIGNMAFGLSHGITSLTIGPNVSSIGTQILDPNIYGNNASVTTITVSSSNPYYSSSGPALFNKNKTTLLYFAPGWSGNYTVPSTVTRIATRAFANHRKLTGITMTSVQTIETEAFLTCTALQYVVFGSSISTLAQNSFYWDVGDNPTPDKIQNYGSNVQYYNFNSATRVPTCSGAFTNMMVGSSHIYVPSGLLNSWKTASGWNGWLVDYITTGTPTLTASLNTDSNGIASLLSVTEEKVETKSSNNIEVALIEKIGLKEDDIDDDTNNDTTTGGDGNNEGQNTPLNTLNKITT